MSNIIPSDSNIVNIQHKNKTLKGSYYQLPFLKSVFLDSRDYVKFIKAVEKLIRISDEYSAYKDYLMNDIGLDHCAIMPNIDSNKEKVTIEMHHGPILTLFDYCDIVTSALINRGEKVNTFMVADIVIKEHFLNNVQVVMLSKTAHQLTHAGKLFIHPGQAWGDLNNFLLKYKEGVTSEQTSIINEYIQQAETYNSTDGDFLKASTVSSWNRGTNNVQEIKENLDIITNLEEELFNEE